MFAFRNNQRSNWTRSWKQDLKSGTFSGRKRWLSRRGPMLRWWRTRQVLFFFFFSVVSQLLRQQFTCAECRLVLTRIAGDCGYGQLTQPFTHLLTASGQFSSVSSTLFIPQEAVPLGNGTSLRSVASEGFFWKIYWPVCMAKGKIEFLPMSA